jgi:hypothetical protein
VCTSVACFMKKRVGHGFFGLLFYPLSLYGALRLAKPDSPWAKRFYGQRNPTKQARAEKRFRHRRADRLYDKLRTAFGGSTNETIEARRRTEYR